MLGVLVLANTVLGLGFFALDWRGAEVPRQLAEEAADWITAHGGGHVWYVGHWGFQYYAERRGMEPLDSAASQLHPGDWLVVPDPRLEQQALRIDLTRLRREATLRADAIVPLRTAPCFYGGRTPLEHHEGTRLEVHIYRVPLIPGEDK
jgi:hypothetical protein